MGIRFLCNYIWSDLRPEYLIYSVSRRCNAFSFIKMIANSQTSEYTSLICYKSSKK